MSKTKRLTLIATATVAATIALPVTAHTDSTKYEFQSPSGDVVCETSTCSDGAGRVFCDVDSLLRPPYPPGCSQGWVYRFSLDQGSAPISHCQEDTIIPGSIPRNRALDTLAYGEKRSAGTLTCDSETSGVACTDSSTGHFFRVSHESYDVG